MSQSQIQNALLLKMSIPDFPLLWPLLTLVDLEPKQVVQEQGEPVRYIHFPENCALSVRAGTPGKWIEIGQIGAEGMTNVPVDPSVECAFQTIVQVPATAWRIDLEDYLPLIRNCPDLFDLTLRYKEAWTIQVAYGSMANGKNTIMERVARVLLMLQDRTQRIEFSLTHDCLAETLRVRRSGVTNAVQMLESEGALRSLRSRVIIRDRDRLERLSGGSYGAPEREYTRWIQ